MVAAMVQSWVESTSKLVEAVRRVAALALVDAALALPSAARPACEAALEALALRPSNGGQFMYYRPSTRPIALLVLCHPSEGPSLCRALADLWEEGLASAGVEVKRVLLTGKGDLPVGSAAELLAAKTGKNPSGEGVPEEVARLQALVEECQFLIFVHPVFWFDVPSQLKAFQDSVLSSGFAFRKLPGHWVLNRAAGIIRRLPGVRSAMRRYSAYGMLRDKSAYVTRTSGGPAAGMGIFGHGATTLESTLRFCGAHVAGVDTVAELDDHSRQEIAERLLPKVGKRIQAHCKAIAAAAAAAAKSPPRPLGLKAAQ